MINTFQNMFRGNQMQSNSFQNATNNEMLNQSYPQNFSNNSMFPPNNPIVYNNYPSTANLQTEPKFNTFGDFTRNNKGILKQTRNNYGTPYNPMMNYAVNPNPMVNPLMPMNMNPMANIGNNYAMNLYPYYMMNTSPIVDQNSIPMLNSYGNLPANRSKAVTFGPVSEKKLKRSTIDSLNRNNIIVDLLNEETKSESKNENENLINTLNNESNEKKKKQYKTSKQNGLEISEIELDNQLMKISRQVKSDQDERVIDPSSSMWYMLNGKVNSLKDKEIQTENESEEDPNDKTLIELLTSNDDNNKSIQVEENDKTSLSQMRFDLFKKNVHLKNIPSADIKKETTNETTTDETKYKTFWNYLKQDDNKARAIDSPLNRTKRLTNTSWLDDDKEEENDKGIFKTNKHLIDKLASF